MVPAALGVMLAGWLIYHFVIKRLGHDINSLNVSLLMLSLLLHRTVKRFTAAVEQGAGRSWAVIVLYHLYAGVAGLIQFTNAGEKVARLAASISDRDHIPAHYRRGGRGVRLFHSIERRAMDGAGVRHGQDRNGGRSLGAARYPGARSGRPRGQLHHTVLVCRGSRHRARGFPDVLRLRRGVRRDLVRDRGACIYLCALLEGAGAGSLRGPAPST